jgi:hypothetical protein
MLKPSCYRPVSQAGGRLKHKPDAEHAVDHEVDDIHQVVLARRGGIRRRQRRYGLCWAAGPRDRRASQRMWPRPAVPGHVMIKISHAHQQLA